MNTLFRAVLSPCIGVCSLDDDGLCSGCHRTSAEIARWSQMNDDERLRLMETTLARTGAAATVKPLPAGPVLPDCPGLMAALHPLASPPQGPGWNLAELSDLVPDGTVSVPAAVLVGLVPRQRRNAGTADPSHRCAAPARGAGQLSGWSHRTRRRRRGGRRLARNLRGDRPGADADRATGFPRSAGDHHRLPRAAGGGAARTTTTSPHPDPNEVADVFEVPLAFLLDPANLATHTLDFRGRPRQVLEYRYPAQRIWGATASMLFNLRQRLEATGMMSEAMKAWTHAGRRRGAGCIAGPRRPGRHRCAFQPGRPRCTAKRPTARRTFPARATHTSIATCPITASTRRAAAIPGRSAKTSPPRSGAGASRRSTRSWPTTPATVHLLRRACGSCCACSATSVSPCSMAAGSAGARWACRSTRVHDGNAHAVLRRLRSDRACSMPKPVQAHLDAGGLLLDARAAERFRGEIEPHRPRRRPRARCAQPSVCTEHARRPLPTRRRNWPTNSPCLRMAGRASDVVVMCGSGVTACHLLLAMEHAGLHGARLVHRFVERLDRRPVAARSRTARRASRILEQ